MSTKDHYSCYKYKSQVLYSRYKLLKIEHYKYYKHFTPFQKNITNITNRKKTTDRVSWIKEKKKLLGNVHVSKKRKTAGKVSHLKKKNKQKDKKNKYIKN